MIEPRATYRIQLRPGFGFDEAAALAPYLAELGVSHLYLSPCFQATLGSTHGYDVVDWHRVNEGLGGATAYARMGDVLRRLGLGQLLDIVPNHMAIPGEQNPWWWDVLENGPSSHYASYFDVDWEPPEARLRNTVLMPVLEDQYGRILDFGHIRLVREQASFRIRYRDHVFPAAPRSLDSIFAAAAERCGSDDLAFVADALDWLPLPTSTDRVSVRRRHRDKAVLSRQVARLFAEHPEIPQAVDGVLAELNANPDALHALLERQNYRLAFWRTAGRDLGYRRFFDINSLIGLRMEDRVVFDDTHLLVLRWLAEGAVDGVRVDHIDGLRAPRPYLERLRDTSRDTWIVVEKILEPGERLPDWPIAGTTGYDFLNRAGGLLVDPAAEVPLTSFYAEFTADPVDFAALAVEKKDLVLRGALGSDVNRLTAMFLEVCEHQRDHRDYTRHDLHEALITTISSFPVYRTYVSIEDGAPTGDDERHVTSAIEAAKALHPDLDVSLFDFLRDLLLLRVRGPLEDELAMRFQQLTGSAMAKGVEDTAFYCFNRMVCLNEVGGDPTRFGVSVDDFLYESAETQRNWPRTLLATSTHDTKRSEDVRARLYLLSEIPDRWTAAVQGWVALNGQHWRVGEPDRSAEYLFYQTLVGAWPITTERVVEYMRKAAREAKRRTSWIDPNAEYEARLLGFVEAAMSDRAFLDELEAFVAPLIEPGRVNSLVQTLLKLTAPGVPDIYQGCELWDLSLVDPDNRRPVDYAARRDLLAQATQLPPAAIWRHHADSGLPKLWLIRQALHLRKRRPELFGPAGDFRPLAVRGPASGHVIAYVRGAGAVALAPRLVLGLRNRWADTVVNLPPGRWFNDLTAESMSGGPTSIANLLRHFPVALLSNEEHRA
jgi:(1->4)-alpha-D-glucan 1-alpha-D-glucosylmutase